MSTANTLSLFASATIRLPSSVAIACKGVSSGKGEPGTGAREPSSLIEKPRIIGEADDATKRNCGESPVFGTRVDIPLGVGVAKPGVGVGVGVGVGKPGVGVSVGVGVGEFPPITILRGEIWQPTTTAIAIATLATVQPSRRGRSRNRIDQQMPEYKRLLPCGICAVSTPMGQ